MRILLGTAMLIAASLAGQTAHADEEEIVVTATRTPTEADLLPARVEVIDRAEIEARALVTLADALGPDAVQNGGAGQATSLFLRGANSKHTLALFDGVRLNDASTPNAQYDFGMDTLGALERIEVLRGPASTIYGSDALGGVVNLIPRIGADAPFDPFLMLSAGSFGTQRGLLGAAGSGGPWSYGLSAEHLRTEGYDLIPDRMSTDTGDADPARMSTFTASLRRDANGFGADLLLRARASRTAYDTFSGGPFFDLRADDPDLENETSQHVWRLGGDIEAGALTFRLSGGQVRSDRSEYDGGVELSSAQGERTFADVSAHYAGGGLALTGGLSFERDAIDTRPQFAAPLTVEENRRAAFALARFALAPNVAITGSARIDDYENFGAQPTWALGAVWTAPSWRLFASYATAFKAPSLSERFEISLFNIGNPSLEPEQSASWEIGADWSPVGALSFGASYYRTEIEDLIEYDFLALQNVNIGDADIAGAEIYAEAALSDRALLRLSYAWTDARNGMTGGQLARRPESAWRLDALLHPSERLTLAFAWTYVGERIDVTYDDAGAFLHPAGRVDAFSVASLTATFDITAHASMFVRVDNIADEIYEQPAAFAGSPRAFTFGVRAGF